MHVGTYPTRNFAQIRVTSVGREHSATSQLLLVVKREDVKRDEGDYKCVWKWTGHFCRPLHVAMQLGLYLDLEMIQIPGV